MAEEEDSLLYTSYENKLTEFYDRMERKEDLSRIKTDIENERIMINDMLENSNLEDADRQVLEQFDETFENFLEYNVEPLLNNNNNNYVEGGKKYKRKSKKHKTKKHKTKKHNKRKTTKKRRRAH
jgi:hypothetical protein